MPCLGGLQACRCVNVECTSVDRIWWLSLARIELALCAIGGTGVRDIQGRSRAR